MIESRYSTITPVEQGQEWLRQFCKQLYVLLSSEQPNNQNIQIELKYAIATVHPDHRNLQALYRQMSHQSILWLRGKQLNCNYRAGFTEFKKFYAMKQLFENVCRENANRAASENEPTRTINFYKTLSQRYNNSQLRMKEPELRIDINHSGKRYTYSHGRGWSVINKERLSDYNLMYCSQTIKMSVSNERNNYEEDGNVADSLRQIFEAKDKPNPPNLRLKNIMKIEKNDSVEISLSEVLIIKDEVKRQKLLELVDFPQALDNYLVNEFANFYNYPMNPEAISFEIESEVTSEGLSKLRQYHRQNRHVEFECFIEIMMQDFCSLFHSDYCIKMEEINVIIEKYKAENEGKVPKLPGRLDNEIGHYMRSELADFMRSRK